MLLLQKRVYWKTIFKKERKRRMGIKKILAIDPTSPALLFESFITTQTTHSTSMISPNIIPIPL